MSNKKKEKAEMNGKEKTEKSESNGSKKKRARTANPLIKIKVLKANLEKLNSRLLKLTGKRDSLKKQFDEAWKEVKEHMSIFKEENGDGNEFDIDATKINLQSEVS